MLRSTETTKLVNRTKIIVIVSNMSEITVWIPWIGEFHICINRPMDEV